MNTLDALLKQFNSGTMSRRQFMKRTAALGMTAAASTSLIGNIAQAATPKRGGHMRVATVQGATTDSLDPILLTSGFTNFTHYTTYSQLTEVAPDGEITPLLAESFEPNGSPQEWVFNLRKGVEFHNGKSVDADDVIASLLRHKGEESKSAMKSFAEEIESIEKDGSHRVIFKLKTPSVDFPVGLSASSLGILPSKDGKVETFGVGTGAYIIERFDAGQSIKFKRNPNYYMPDRAFVDTAELFVIADSAARQNALSTKSVDIIGDVDTKTVHLLAKRPGVTVLDVTAPQHYTFPMRTDLAPFDNYHVRMALKLSIDREEVLQKILRGHGTLGNDHPISTVNRYHNAELPQRQYDPEKAKWHMKQSGLGKLKFELSASDGLYSGAMDTAILFSEHAKKAGIEITPKREPDDGYWSNVWMKKPWAASYWSGRPTEDWMFTQGYSETSNWNESFWRNQRFNELLVSARAELDTSKRRDMYHEMQKLVHDDGGSVIHLFSNHLIAHNDNVGAPSKIAGNWEFDGYKMFERWWMV